MTEKSSGGGGGSHYTVHAKKIKTAVFGNEADQHNDLQSQPKHQPSAKSKGTTVLVAVAAVAAVTALAALVALAVVLFHGDDGPAASARPDSSALPGPPSASPTTPGPASSHRTSPAPGPGPGRPPDASPWEPGLPPGPLPTVHATRPPAKSAPSAQPASPAAPAAPAASTTPAPRPSSARPCPSRDEYRLTNKAQVWNAEGEHIGDVSSGTLFFRQEVASYPAPVYDRYYGTVDQPLSGSATGYVLRKKLDYVGTVESCRGTAP
ncbi:hypothetical protein [Streptomyces sp. CA-111067]|uniref:hypothetical protein n=1 Tax=Streptomyces sp. CA-111067 TaxID=3240046 RepID=UPI003D986B47